MGILLIAVRLSVWILAVGNWVPTGDAHCNNPLEKAASNRIREHRAITGHGKQHGTPEEDGKQKTGRFSEVNILGSSYPPESHTLSETLQVALLEFKHRFHPPPCFFKSQHSKVLCLLLHSSLWTDFFLMDQQHCFFFRTSPAANLN